MSKKRSRTLRSVADPVALEPGHPADTFGGSPIADSSAYERRVPAEEAVVRRTRDGWRVGDDELPDLTCAMVLADLLAAELPTEIQPAIPAGPVGPPPPLPPAVRPARGDAARAELAADEEANRLRTTVGQLEHALTARVRIEQAIGVLSERHRIRPRQAFEQLRSAARNRGRKVIDIATDVVASASNPLLQLPEELSRQRPAPRHAAPRNPRRVLRSE
jgi:ANTAR domain